MRDASLMKSEYSASRWEICLFNKSRCVRLRWRIKLLNTGARAPTAEPPRAARALIIAGFTVEITNLRTIAALGRLCAWFRLVPATKQGWLREKMLSPNSLSHELHPEQTQERHSAHIGDLPNARLP